MPQRPLAAGSPGAAGPSRGVTGSPSGRCCSAPNALPSTPRAWRTSTSSCAVRRGWSRCSQRLRKDSAAISAVHRQLSADIEQGRAVTPAAEWLVDNMHVVERQVGQIRQDLPPLYFAELPKLGSGFLAGHPRIFALMWASLAHSDSLVDPSLLAGFIRAYKRRKALTIGELWAVSRRCASSSWKTCAGSLRCSPAPPGSDGSQTTSPTDGSVWTPSPTGGR